MWRHGLGSYRFRPSLFSLSISDIQGLFFSGATASPLFSLIKAPLVWDLQFYSPTKKAKIHLIKFTFSFILIHWYAMAIFLESPNPYLVKPIKERAYITSKGRCNFLIGSWHSLEECFVKLICLCCIISVPFIFLYYKHFKLTNIKTEVNGKKSKKLI